jgi:hypothetical protein
VKRPVIHELVGFQQFIHESGAEMHGFLGGLPLGQEKPLDGLRIGKPTGSI